MMTLSKVYIKGKHEVTTSSKFIYQVTIYKIWKLGCSLLSERYYALPRLLDLKNLPSQVQANGYILQRYITLEGAPETYLIQHGYKQKN